MVFKLLRCYLNIYIDDTLPGDSLETYLTVDLFELIF